MFLFARSHLLLLCGIAFLQKVGAGRKVVFMLTWHSCRSIIRNMSNTQSNIPEDGPSLPVKKSRWLDKALWLFGFACITVFAIQMVVRVWFSSPVISGQVMSGLGEEERIPLARGDAKGYNVLVISMDTTRADHLGCYGNRGVQTPNIDALARNGVLFEHAFTPSPSTLPGHASIFTGLYPYNHGARSNGSFRLSEEPQTIAEILKGEGYATAAVISAYVLDSRFGLDQGFDAYLDDLTKGVKYGDHTFRERPATYADEVAIEWLDENASQSSPFFLWVHYFDPHAPYVPPEPFRKQYEAYPYAGEIAYVDYNIGLLFEKLKELGVYDKTLVVLAGDHGEGLGEHGEKTHSMLVYDATLHTPLIFSSPTLFASGSVVRKQVCNTCIVPTVLDMLGVSTTASFDGVSLLRPPAEWPGGIYIENIATLVLHGWAPLFAIRHDDVKYIHAPTPELYDVQEDPRELKNIFDERAEIAAALSKELDKHVGNDKYGGNALSQAVTMDPETARNMAALGYVGSAKTGTVDAEKAAQFDPKDMIYHWEAVQEGSNLVSQGKYHEGRELLEAAVAEVPGDVYALRNLAGVYSFMSEPDAAIEAYKEVLKYEQGDATVYVSLAYAYITKQEFGLARECSDKALDLDPNFGGGYLVLGTLAALNERVTEAEALFRTAIEVDPGTTGPRAYVSLGQMFLNRLQIEESRKAFESALEIDNLNGAAHAGLGGVFLAEGNMEEAEKSYSRALRYTPNHPVYLANMAGMVLKKGDDKQARELVQRALDVSPNNPAALNNLGLVLKHDGEIEKAMDVFSRVLLQEPDHLQCRLNLALCYRAVGREEDAVGQYEEVLRRNGSVPSALANLGTYHALHNRPGKAKQFYRRALAVKPDYALVHAQFGALLLREGKTKLALFHMRKSLEIEPDRPGSEELEHQVSQLERVVQNVGTAGEKEGV